MTLNQFAEKYAFSGQNESNSFHSMHDAIHDDVTFKKKMNK